MPTIAFRSRSCYMPFFCIRRLFYLLSVRNHQCDHEPLISRRFSDAKLKYSMDY